MSGEKLIGAVVIVTIGLAIVAAHGAEIPRSALQYQAQITREARYALGLDAPVAMFGAQIHQESGYDPNAKSPYASGLAQFTPGTASWIAGLYKTLGPAAPLDPEWAIRAMITYDVKLHDDVRIADTECDRWLFSLSDYNGGSGWRISRQGHSQAPGSYSATSTINPGISAANQRQNAEYPPRIVYTLQPIYKGWSTAMICAP